MPKVMMISGLGAALPSGSYRRPIGKVLQSARPSPSLGRAGLRGMCDDAGWMAAMGLTAGAGSAFTTGATSTSGGRTTTDSGFAAVGAGLTATSAYYAQLCAAQNQQSAGDPTISLTFEQQLALERARAQAGAVSMQQTSSGAAPARDYTPYIAGAALLGALGLAAVVLLK